MYKYYKDKNDKLHKYQLGVISEAEWKEDKENALGIALIELTKTQFDQLVYEKNNPPKTPEQIKQELTLEVDKYLKKEIDKYNKTNGTLFASVHNCATYVLVDTYPHRQFCVDIINFNAAVWEKARSIEYDVLAEKREMPTVEEFIAELPVFGN